MSEDEQPQAKGPPSAHDTLFRFTFERTEHAIAELRCVLPRALVDRVEWPTLRVIPGTFIDEDFAKRESDLLYQVKLAGREALLYVLFEHQSSVDKWMPLRLLGYVVRALERYARDQNRLPLPAIIPLVLHHSPTGWTAARSLQEMFESATLRWSRRSTWTV